MTASAKSLFRAATGIAATEVNDWVATLPPPDHAP